MNWLKSSLPALSIILACFVSQAQPKLHFPDGENWTSRKVADGIVLHRAAFEGKLFGSNQYVCVLEIAPGCRFDIVPSERNELELTSGIAGRSGATVAVNGSFFNMRPPYGSANYLRVDGEELAANAPDTYENPGGGRSTRQSGAIATFEGSLHILKGDAIARWERDIAAEDIVTTGPVLLIDGDCEFVVADSFNTTRHPRTAAGRRSDGTVLLVTVDGRNEKAAGLSMSELQQIMLELGCRDAINLDGGGSTAMVVCGEVVNHPSDNGKFDAEGERPVANAICVQASVR